MQLAALALTALILITTGSVSNQAYAQAEPVPRVIAEGVEITLPNDWRVATRSQIAQFEAARDRLLAQSNLRPSVEPREVVSFQAEAGTGTSQAFIGITFIPVGEASQEQVARYHSEKIQNIGAKLIEQHRKSLSAARCTDVSFSAPALVNVGEKKAIGFTVQFTTPDGVPRVGSKQHVYMRNATVVLTSAAPADTPQTLRDQMSSALSTVRLTEN